MRTVGVVLVVLIACLGLMLLIRLDNLLWGYVGMYVVAIAGAVAIVIALRSDLGSRKISSGDDEEIPAPHCQRCGYNLRGLTLPRCPECAKPFNPSTVEEK